MSGSEPAFNIKSVLLATHCQPVAYYPIYAKITGSVTSGVLLSQIIFKWSYWGGKKFFKTDMELRGETGLSDEDMRRAKKAIAQLPFLSISREGVPARTHYDIDAEKLAEFLSSYEERISSSGDVSPTGSGDVSPTAIYGRARKNETPYETHNKSKILKPPKSPEISPQLEILIVTEFPPEPRQTPTQLDDAGIVLAHLNTLTNRSYRVTKYIAARLKDGYSVKECCLVLEWLHIARRATEPDWVERYLDHTTPFREDNFDKYLQRAREWEAKGCEVPQPANRRAATHGLTDKEYNTVASAAELAQELLHGERRRPTFPQITR